VAQAKYQEIAERLRDQITSGLLAPDDRLPSEPDLERKFDASRNTVRLALALLTNQGLVVTRQGLGTFVLGSTKPFTALLSRVKGQPSGHHASMALPVVGPDPSKPETVRFVVETAPATASVAEKLAVEPGEQVIVRRTSQHIDGVPWLLINSYFTTDLAGGTALAQGMVHHVGIAKLNAVAANPSARRPRNAQHRCVHHYHVIGLVGHRGDPEGARNDPDFVARAVDLYGGRRHVHSGHGCIGGGLGHRRAQRGAGGTRALARLTGGAGCCNDKEQGNESAHVHLEGREKHDHVMKAGRPSFTPFL